MALRTIGRTLGTIRTGLAPVRKKAAPFYTSTMWRDLMASIKAERGAFCERCGSGHRVIGDHKVEIKDGGAPLDRANVELLCQACHNAKTARARARRAATAPADRGRSD